MKRIAKNNKNGLEKNKEYTMTQDLIYLEYYKTECGLYFLKENLRKYFYTPNETLIEAEINTPNHYDNSKGTLYKVAQERGWNPYLFDIVKRLERAEKKGEFESDLDKSIAVIQLWKNEQAKESGVRIQFTEK
jgi:hypothetical protein